ncbi:hypothetical protein Vadar_023111 [Vaccinium darrowii]|uniref:Uncharacterized protein n=1 Tax=Vaccinium darrowii TaxID=229202 RepID=A0ACB7XJE2_9ERIC|nr:hypothetical protein Vadar_023111 [Vaccinium darrowii]
MDLLPRSGGERLIWWRSGREMVERGGGSGRKARLTERNKGKRKSPLDGLVHSAAGHDRQPTRGSRPRLIHHSRLRNGGFWLYCKIYSQEDPQEEAGPDPASAELARAGPGPALGLDPHSINLFPLVQFPVSVPVGFGGSECQICLEEFVKGEDVRVLPTCRHIFHDKCIRSWLTSHTQCAVCRYQYSGWEPGVLPPDAP